MRFDVSKIDKNLLLQTLYAHAEPIGLGRVEFLVKSAKGINVEGLSYAQCEEIWAKKTKSSDVLHVDYLNGKPIKLILFPKSHGRLLCCSESYDARNGRFRFLEALLNTFDQDEIIVVKKEIGAEVRFEEQKGAIPKRSKEDLVFFNDIVKSMIKSKENNLIKWTIDAEKVIIAPILKELFK
jgi:hypothetical protein